jgi:photosystem II stability/assembly factor-like uncharacterized protein
VPLRIGFTTQDNGAYQTDGDPRVVEIDNHEGGWIEYDPSDSSTLYLDTRGLTGPYPMRKSTQGGEPGTWQELGIESDAAIREALSIAQGDRNRLLVVDSQGRLHRSTTGGVPATNWRVVLAPAGVHMIAVEFAPSNSSHAYAASDRGRVWHSADGGATWQELPGAGLPPHPVNDVEIDHRNPLRLYLALGSDDVTFGTDVAAVWRGDVTASGGATWTDVSGTPPDSLPLASP